ncbi:hypothetical protein AAFF_G00331130 [Aldrovandia affinis]|uniref:Rab-GAP TBC domain-containing protein n=1 Tax=Aldrovandia affinis TaxID=143900 RepID=A0AAD7R6D1_9TELE|nr:hypothetical protein AAFF_G00331130 [Aldrovandia affinis]
MKSLLNPEFHEHDAYAMFSQLMETAEPWFSSFEREVRKGKDEVMTSIPFARPQDAGPSVAIVTKVNRIQDQLVKKHDIELHMHLNRLEIAPQIYGIRWVRLLFGREFLLQEVLVVWDALFADSITLDLVDYVFVAMLLYIRDALIASNFQTCLGLLMHYPPIGDIHPPQQGSSVRVSRVSNNPRPVNYQFQQNLEFYKTRGADLMSKTRGRSRTAPLNKVSSTSECVCVGETLEQPLQEEDLAQPSESRMACCLPGAQVGDLLEHADKLLARAGVDPVVMVHVGTNDIDYLNMQEIPGKFSRTRGHRSITSQSQRHVQSGRECESVSVSRRMSQSPSVESLPEPPSPPLSASRKDSFFNISRSHSLSKTIGKKEADDEREVQVSFLQGQLNDLEAMCKYCAKMMNVHIGKIQEVILQENLQKEDEVLVSLAELKQIKDILKGALRFNQSQLEAEDNEELNIADDHYCSTAQNERNRRDAKGTRPQPLPPDPQAGAYSEGSTLSDGRHWDDYILISQEEEVPLDPECPARPVHRAQSGRGQGRGRGRGRGRSPSRTP